MKTITRIFGMFLMAMAIIFMDACKGEKGDVGPSGTTGVAGPTGANGAVGVAGPTGTANVVYGTWQDMNNTNFWYKLGASNTTGGANNGGGSYNAFSNRGWGCDIPAPITQDVLDKGQVFVYGKFAASIGDNRVYLLPNNFWGNWSHQVNILLNRIYIQTIWDVALTAPTTYNPSGFLCFFRYIVIPGGVAGGRKANVDYNDYEAVKKAYNIPD
jgi:hypothetical protein